MERLKHMNELTEEELSGLAERLCVIAKDLPSEDRQRIREAETIVVKMGTSSLTYPSGKLNLKKIGRLSRVLTDLKNSGKKIVLISSGALGCGAARLGLKERPTALKDKQATAAVGQSLLMEIYQQSFSDYHQNIAQILLTKDVFDGGIKEENCKETFKTLFDFGVIPIVNENDAISTDEIQEECFGDNDILSAMTAALVEADLLLILSDVNGLYDRSPKEEGASQIPQVDEITDEICKIAGEAGTRLGTGGMATKIGAARYAADRGIETVIASAEDVDNIYKILDGVCLGTYFTRDCQRSAG